MTNLAQETAAAKALIDHIREQYPEEDDKLLMDTLEGETDLLRICSWLIFRMGTDEASIVANKTYQANLADRNKRLAERVEKNRSRLLVMMDALGVKKMEFDCATLSVRLNQPKVIVDNDTGLPSRFYDPGKPVLNKDRVKVELQQGVPIPGAKLSNAEPSLTIRRK